MKALGYSKCKIGNSCRPKHRSKDAGPASKGLSELSRQSSLRKTSLAERISSGATGSPAPGRRATAGGNVFNRRVNLVTYQNKW